jgi:hypothetical protein
MLKNRKSLKSSLKLIRQYKELRNTYEKGCCSLDFSEGVELLDAGNNSFATIERLIKELNIATLKQKIR